MAISFNSLLIKHTVTYLNETEGLTQVKSQTLLEMFNIDLKKGIIESQWDE